MNKRTVFYPYYNRIPLIAKETYLYDFGSTIFWSLYNGVVLFLAPIILKKTFQITNFQLSIVTSAFWMSSLFSPFISHIARYVKIKPLITIPSSIARGLLILFIFKPSNSLIILIFFLSQLIDGITFPIYSMILKINYPEKYRGRIMGFVRFGISSFTIIYVLILGILLTHYPEFGYYTFVVGGISGFLAAVIFSNINVFSDINKLHVNFYSLKKHLSVKTTFNSIINIVIKNNEFRKFVLIFGLFYLSMGFLTVINPIYLVKKLKVSYTEASIILGALPLITGVLTYVMWGHLTDKYSPFMLIAFAFLLNSIGSFIIVFNKLLTAAIAFIFFSISRTGLEMLLFISVFKFSPEEETGLYTSALTFIMSVFTTIGIYLSPLLLNIFPIEYIFISAGFISFLSSLLMYFLFKK